MASGFTLICVSALEKQYRDARLSSLLVCGFLIDVVIATPDYGSSGSPKAKSLTRLLPAAFVEDFAPYLRGVPPSVHRALILREPAGSPDIGEVLTLADSTHANLAEFAGAWCALGARH
jgi:hypothetical protein